MTDVHATTFDAERAEAFGQRVLDDLNSSALVLMMSIGHRTGLFDVMSRMSPASSEAIASEAGLAERYVREWLGAMVTGRIVEYDAGAHTYFLPPEHAASLTRDARPGNMAVTCQWIPLLGSVEDEIVDVFQRGGGVPYDCFERFHAVMAEESDQTVVAALSESILPLVPGLVEALEAGIEVLDIGCGSGRALAHLAAQFPKSRFRGYDFSAEGVSIATEIAAEQGLTNLSFHCQDAAALQDRERFDLITAFDAIHDQARPDRVLEGISRALRPGGVFLMQDIAGSSRVDQDVDHPAAPLLYTISCMHCMTVSLANDGMGLGAMWGAETAIRMLGAAGFRDVSVQKLSHDVMNYYYTARK